MFRSDQELGSRGSGPLLKTGKCSYVFLIEMKSISDNEHKAHW